jgi:hypothetical protein
LSFFTYSFVILPSDLMKTSKLLGFYIIMGWITLLPHIKVFFLIILNYGAIINDDVWKNLTRTGKLFNLCSLISNCISSYFMFVIGPFFSSCGIYTGYLACHTVQIIAFMAFVVWCIFGLILLYIIIFILACIIIHGINSFQNQPFMTDQFIIPPIPSQSPESVFQQTDPIMLSATRFLETYNPIPDPEPMTKCAICQYSVEEIDDQWTRLQCGHLGHQKCFSEWYIYDQSCPYCRTSINIFSFYKYSYHNDSFLINLY